jgi:hypothetical protein
MTFDWAQGEVTMARALALLTGTAAIDAAIRELKGIGENFNERVQQAAVSIINHDIESNDCSRALALVMALSQTTNRTFLIRFFQYFGAIGIDVKGARVRHIDPKSKSYRKPDLAGAKANKWFEPFDAAGKKADWYEGPNPALFEPNTIGDFGANIINFADRLTKQLDAERDNGAGTKVPVYGLSADEKKLALGYLDSLRKLGLGVMARDEIERLTPLVNIGERMQAAAADAGQPKSDDEQAAVEEPAVQAAGSAA